MIAVEWQCLIITLLLKIGEKSLHKVIHRNVKAVDNLPHLLET